MCRTKMVAVSVLISLLAITAANVASAKTVTSTTLTSSPNPSTFSQTVTFTATVTPVPTGTVTFKDGAAAIAVKSLNGSGMATFSTLTLEVGIHSITAEYGGDASFNGSTSSPLTQVVEEEPDPPDPFELIQSTLEEIQNQLTSIEQAQSSIVDLLTNPAFGLEEIKREVSGIEENLHKLDVKIIHAKQSSNRVFFVLTSLGGIGVDANVSAVELGGEALKPSDFRVIRVSLGLVKLTLNRKAIRDRGSHPLLVEMEAAIDGTILSGVDIIDI